MNITLVTAPQLFFGQSRKPWVSLDTPKLIQLLQDRGYEVELLEFSQLAARLPSIHNRDIFYAFSQREHLRGYIRDLMQIASRDNHIIPSLDLLLSHENKGYAELYKQRLDITEPKAFYLSELDDIAKLELSYPIVLKTISGTNAKGVWLCRSESELRKKVKALAPPPPLPARLDLLRRKHLRGKRTYPGYPGFEPKMDADDWLEYMTPRRCFLLQEFIPGLDCDYRVIAVHDRFYLMRRMANKGDFRASGTKKFVFDFTPPEGLLAFARDVFQRFDTPFLSMDIGYSAGRCHLFEFQALHFGTAAIVRSEGFYQFDGEGWSYVKQPSGLEETLVYGLDGYLPRRG